MNKNKLNDFRKLYDEHNLFVRKSLHWLVREEVLNEVVQDVFVKIWNSMDKFQGQSKFNTWVYRIAMNCAYDHLRKEKRHTPLEIKGEIGMVNSAEEGKMFQEILKGAIDQLSSKQKPAFVLFYLQEKSVAEIADILKIAEGTVKSRLHTARETVTQILRKFGYNYDK